MVRGEQLREGPYRGLGAARSGTAHQSMRTGTGSPRETTGRLAAATAVCASGCAAAHRLHRLVEQLTDRHVAQRVSCPSHRVQFMGPVSTSGRRIGIPAIG